MKYVVSGATGFIGRAVVDFLLNNKHEVYAVSRSIIRVQALWQNEPHLYAIECEMGGYISLANQIERADVFISLAWAGTVVDDRYSVELQTRNKLATLDAMRAAKQMGCKLFVATGSQAEYGMVDGAIDENTPCSPTMAYGQAKLDLLDEARHVSKELGLPYLHLRIFSVFGDGDHPYTLIETAIAKMKANEKVDLSPCTQLWNFLYVKDMAYQIVALSEAVINGKAETGVYNMASDDTRELKSYVEELKQILCSTSELAFGAMQPPRLASINPDTTKLKNAIGKLNTYTFERAVLDMKR